MAAPHGFGVLFLNAAESGNVPLLQSLSLQFENGEGPGQVLYAELKTPEGENALHLAAVSGMTEACSFLIDILGFDIDATYGDEGETSLFGAIIYRRWSTAVFLISSGADITKRNIFGDTILHCAASSGSRMLVELLISNGCDVNATSQRGTPLGMAASNGRVGVVKYLLEHKADPNLNTVDTSPLFMVIHGEPKPSIECMELLLKAGAEPNRQCYGKTPLCVAATLLDADTIRCLLKAGSDANIPDYVGYTPLEHAALLGHRKLVDLIFPVTSHIARYPNWSIEGVMQHVQSIESSQLFLSKRKESVPFAKRKGEEAFRRKSYLDAYNWFSEAIRADPTNAKLLSNRSLCYIKTNHGKDALKDALACISLEPSWAKAHYREGAAWTVLKDFKKAAKAFSRALALDPGNYEIEMAHRDAQAALN